MNLKLIISVIIVGMSSQSVFGGSLLSRGPRPVEARSETVQQVVVERQPEVIVPMLVQESKEEVQVAEVADVQPSQVQETTFEEQHAEVKGDAQILQRILDFIENNKKRRTEKDQNGRHDSRGYHARKLARFIYAAQHEPTASELKLISVLRKQGKTALVADIEARLNYCNDHDNDWRSNQHWSVFYHIKAIADDLYWTPNDTIQAGRVFLSYLLALHAAR